MSKRVVIVHAWDEGPTSCWYPWLKQQLETKGITVVVPEMPHPSAPEIDPWVATLREIAPNPDQETIFVGHSVGCQTILRYLVTLNESVQIGGAVFVAPWTHLMNLSDESLEVARPWLGTMLDWESAKKHCPKFTAFFSDDDEWVPLSEATLFKDKLGAESRVLYQMGHFDQIAQLPELLNEIIGG